MRRCKPEFSILAFFRGCLVPPVAFTLPHPIRFIKWQRVDHVGPSFDEIDQGRSADPEYSIIRTHPEMTGVILEQPEDVVVKKAVRSCESAKGAFMKRDQPAPGTTEPEFSFAVFKYVPENEGRQAVLVTVPGR